MLDVMDRASERLDLAWMCQKPKPARGPTRWAFFGWSWSSSPGSLPLLPDRHSEISKSWGKPYSCRLLFINTQIMFINTQIMRILRVWPSTDTWGCPLLSRRLRAISRRASHPLWRLPPCHQQRLRPLHTWKAGCMWQQVRLVVLCTPWRCYRPIRLICWRIWAMGVGTIVCGWDRTHPLLKTNDIGPTHFYHL